MLSLISRVAIAIIFIFSFLLIAFRYFAFAIISMLAERIIFSLSSILLSSDRPFRFFRHCASTAFGNRFSSFTVSLSSLRPDYFFYFSLFRFFID